jgi:2-C-methyl-D-erythritol 4-phosphate cytidylyltransferase
MKKIALIVAAGNGVRMNNEIPKQFILIKHKPILYYSIKSFFDAFDDLEIILVLPQEYMANGQEIVDGYFDNTKFRFCAGGRTRFHSVKNGLSLLDENEEAIIFVHDGVRCLLSPDLVHRCYESALEWGTAIPAIACVDSLRFVEGDENKIVEREKIRAIQTPQTFHSKILIPAFHIDYKDQFTDEASVVEAYGLKVNLVEGEESNFKITNPIDFQIAQLLLSK